MMVGAFGEHQEMTEEVASLVTALKGDIESSLESAFEVFEPLTYSSQVVAGTNFMVRVHIGEEKHVVAKIHRPLPHRQQAPHLMSVNFEAEQEAEAQE